MTAHGEPARQDAADRKGPSGNGTSGPSGARRLLYREVIDSIDPDFDRAFDLYHRVFPPKERISRDYFVVLLEAKRAGRLSPDNFRFIICRDGDEVVGLSTGRYIERLNVGFVGYLVVAPAHRSRRIGSALRGHLIKGFKRDAQLAGHDTLEAIIGEVEAVNPWISILVGQKKVFALDVDYRQPPLTPGGPEVPLVLYYQPMPPTELPAKLPASKVAMLLSDIFRTVYRIREPESCAVLQDMLAHLDQRDEVGQRDLEAARRAAREAERRAGGSG